MMEFRLRRICIDGLLGGQVQVMMSYETCCVLFLTSSSSGPFWTRVFLSEIPQRAILAISLVFKTGKNDGGVEIIGVCVKRNSFPSLPLLRLSLFLPSLGDGRFVALSVSCVMEWNISLAIFLATKSVLCLDAVFSFSWSSGKYWMEEDQSHSCSVHWPSSISAQPRRTCVCCCYRAGLLGQEPLGESGMSTLAQPRWASFT